MNSNLNLLLKARLTGYSEIEQSGVTMFKRGNVIRYAMTNPRFTGMDTITFVETVIPDSIKEKASINIYEYLYNNDSYVFDGKAPAWCSDIMDQLK